MSWGHLSWWKLTFTLKMCHLGTRTHEKLAAEDLGTYFNCETQWLCIMKQIRACTKQEECKPAEVRSHPEAELQTLWLEQVPWTQILAFLFSSPGIYKSEFRGKAFSFSPTIALSLCFPFAMSFLLMRELPRFLLWFLDNREAQRKKQFCSWFSGTCHHFMWLNLLFKNCRVAIKSIAITAAYCMPSIVLFLTWINLSNS